MVARFASCARRTAQTENGKGGVPRALRSLTCFLFVARACRVYIVAQFSLRTLTEPAQGTAADARSRRDRSPFRPDAVRTGRRCQRLWPAAPRDHAARAYRNPAEPALPAAAGYRRSPADDSARDPFRARDLRSGAA